MIRPFERIVRAVSGRRAAAPGLSATPVEAEYAAWLSGRLAERSARPRPPAPAGLLSLITCVYAGSGVRLFAETRDSVLTQTEASFEWLILANGSLPAPLEQAVTVAAADPRVTLIRRPQNLGIMGGMRVCLEVASGDYVLPLDGDDLLTPDAVAVLAEALVAGGLPLFLYGDEDAWVEGEPRHPYLRPDWDPVLNLASSYVWHPAVFRRDEALRIGVFADSRSEYCQDWDTLFRFLRAGAEPVHLPEILYHWRAHEGSSTNRADRVQGSLDSQRHVLEVALAETSAAQHFEIAEFPLDRGLPEWWVRRRHVEPPAIDALLLADDPAGRAGGRAHDDHGWSRAGAGPIRAVRRLPADITVSELAGHAGSADADIVLIADAALTPIGDDWAWEAAGLLELFPRVVAVGGRVLDESGVVQTGELLVGPDGELVCPDAGRAATDPGYYAFALKPRLTDAVDGRLMFVRREWLAEALRELPAQAKSRFLGVWLAAVARRRGGQIAYSPVVAASAPFGYEWTEMWPVEERAAFAAVWAATPASARWETRRRAALLGENRPCPDPRS